MFSNIPILTLIMFIPLIGALILGFIAKFAGPSGREQLDKNAPRVALLVSGFVFLLSLLLTFDFDSSKAGFQFLQETPWLGGGIEYRVGVDGISVLFILLTAFLTPLCIIASGKSIKSRMLEYMVAVSYTHLTLPTILLV